MKLTKEWLLNGDEKQFDTRREYINEIWRRVESDREAIREEVRKEVTEELMKDHFRIGEEIDVIVTSRKPVRCIVRATFYNDLYGHLDSFGHDFGWKFIRPQKTRQMTREEMFNALMSTKGESNHAFYSIVSTFQNFSEQTLLELCKAAGLPTETTDE